MPASAKDDADRTVLSKLQGVYGTAKPEIQTALSIVLDPNKPKLEKAKAALYLKNAGVDLEKIVGPKAEKRREPMSTGGR